MMLGGPNVRFWQAPGAISATPPKFVRLLGAVSPSTSSTSISVTIVTTPVPIGHNVVVVWTGHRDANYAQLTDTVLNSYNVKVFTTGTSTFTRTQLVGEARLTTALAVGDSITVKIPVTKVTPGTGQAMMAFEYTNLPGNPLSLLNAFGTSPVSLHETPLRKPAVFISTGISETTRTPNKPTVTNPFTLRHYLTPYTVTGTIYGGYAYADAIVDALTSVTAKWTWPSSTRYYNEVYLLGYT